MATKEEIKDIISSAIINQDDIIYTHSVFVQCFLPVRSLPKGTDTYQINHGNASILIRAGLLVNPSMVTEWEKQEIPAGPKARLLIAYINDQAVRRKSPFINMGKSLHDFMTKNGIPIGGENAKELTRQAKNIATAQILIGVWEENRVTCSQDRIVDEINLWVKPNSTDGKIWNTEWSTTMMLSSKYMESIQRYRVPLDFRAIVGLQANPRAMDVYCWLAYRLRRVKTAVKIPYTALHPIFGKNIQNLRDFKIKFKQAVIGACKFYPEARVEISDKDYIVLKESPSPIPPKNEIGHGKALIPRK